MYQAAGDARLMTRVSDRRFWAGAGGRTREGTGRSCGETRGVLWQPKMSAVVLCLLCNAEDAMASVPQKRTLLLKKNRRCAADLYVLRRFGAPPRANFDHLGYLGYLGYLVKRP